VSTTLLMSTCCWLLLLLLLLLGSNELMSTAAITSGCCCAAPLPGMPVPLLLPGSRPSFSLEASTEAGKVVVRLETVAPEEGQAG
jgi:hypothetical protein